MPARLISLSKDKTKAQVVCQGRTIHVTWKGDKVGWVDRWGTAYKLCG